MTEKCYNRHKAKPNSEYYIKSWYCHKPESMKELSRFRASIKPPKINQEVSHLNRPITEKIKIVKTNKQKSLPTLKILSKINIQSFFNYTTEASLTPNLLLWRQYHFNTKTQ